MNFDGACPLILRGERESNLLFLLIRSEPQFSLRKNWTLKTVEEYFVLFCEKYE